MTKRSTKVLFEPTPKQAQYMEAVFSGKYTQLMYGGAIRGGKSFVSVAILYLLCKLYPGSRWAVVRKDLPTLKRNTVPILRKLMPQGFASILGGGNPHTVRCINGSEILIFPESASGDKDLNRWRGLEVNGFLLEEANEIGHGAFEKAIERAGSWTIEGLTEEQHPPPLILLTCNPANNWVKEVFYEPFRNGTMPEHRFYLPANPLDNPYVRQAQLTEWERWKEESPSKYKAMILGDWEAADMPDQLIPWQWVEDAFTRGESTKEPKGEHWLGVDVARYGQDKTTIAHRIGNRLEAIVSWEGQDLMRTANAVALMIRDYKINPANVLVDSVGIGSGVVDRLREMGYAVTEFSAGERPDVSMETIDLKNKRAHGWWNLRELLREGTIEFNPELREIRELMSDLTAQRYKFASEREFQLLSKLDIKTGKNGSGGLGRSPDFGDAVMQAFYGVNDTQWLYDLAQW